MIRSEICPVCGSTDRGTLRAVEDHEYRTGYTAAYISCGTCRTARQVPMPSPERLSSFYPADYHSKTRKSLLGRIRNTMRLNRLKKWMRPQGAVLDYGCGDGAFLFDAADAMPGRIFFGYEIATVPSVKKHKNGAVTIVEGSLEDLLKELPTCGLITMNHVIEHLPDPMAVISALQKKLSAGGVLEGQTPAAASFEQKIFRTSWSGYHAPRHTVIFSKRGLRVFLKKAGFEKIKIRGAFNPAALAVSLASSVRKSGDGRIRRKGLSWLLWLGLATLLAPFDLCSGKPGIINFSAVKNP